MHGVSKLVEQVLELLWSEKCWQSINSRYEIFSKKCMDTEIIVKFSLLKNSLVLKHFLVNNYYLC